MSSDTILALTVTALFAASVGMAIYRRLVAAQRDMIAALRNTVSICAARELQATIAEHQARFDSALSMRLATQAVQAVSTWRAMASGGDTHDADILFAMELDRIREALGVGA